MSRREAIAKQILIREETHWHSRNDEHNILSLRRAAFRVALQTFFFPPSSLPCHTVLPQWDFHASGPVCSRFRFWCPLIGTMALGGWGGDGPIWLRQLGPQLEGQTVTADSPQRTRLQQWMDELLEGGWGTKKAREGKGERKQQATVANQPSSFLILQVWSEVGSQKETAYSAHTKNYVAMHLLNLSRELMQIWAII